MSASSSEVRSEIVAIRQWSMISRSENRPITVCVFPQSMATSMARYLPPTAVSGVMSKAMSSAGADCVITLVEIASAPASA